MLRYNFAEQNHSATGYVITLSLAPKGCSILTQGAALCSGAAGTPLCDEGNTICFLVVLRDGYLVNPYFYRQLIKHIYFHILQDFYFPMKYVSFFYYRISQYIQINLILFPVYSLFQLDISTHISMI